MTRAAAPRMTMTKQAVVYPFSNWQPDGMYGRTGLRALKTATHDGRLFGTLASFVLIGLKTESMLIQDLGILPQVKGLLHLLTLTDPSQDVSVNRQRVHLCDQLRRLLRVQSNIGWMSRKEDQTTKE